MRYGLWMSLILLCAVAAPATAYVGEPTGTFGLKITQGSNVIVDNPAVPVPSDIKISDGDPEDFVVVGMIGPVPTPIILKLVTEDDPNYRIAHFYVDVPISVADIHTPGPTSLFDPAGPIDITVEITGLTFAGTPYVLPRVEPNDTFFTAFMRDEGGRFYNLPKGVTVNFPGPWTEVQVPGSAFLDAEPAYQFRFVDGGSATIIWEAIYNPGSISATVNDGFNPAAPATGYVFELGVGVAFVPEPATIALLTWPMLLLVRTRAFRRRG